MTQNKFNTWDYIVKMANMLKNINKTLSASVAPEYHKIFVYIAIYIQSLTVQFFKYFR